MTQELEIRILQAGDEKVLANVAPDVFDNPINLDSVREFLSDPRHHIAVAVDAGQVVGFASGVHYIHPDKAAELWVNEVAVAPSHRRRGLGRAVLKALLTKGRKLGCSCAWVLTDRENPAAMALYTSVGGTEGADGGADRTKPMVGYTFALVDGCD